MKSATFRSVAIALGVTLLCVATFITTSAVFPWTRFNCWYQDVDIKTGRVREGRYLLCLKLYERTRNTAVTEALPASARDTAPEWQRANTLSWPTGNSPHYNYHGAIYQMQEIEQAWQWAEFQPEAKQRVAETLLRLWQTAGNYFSAEDYVLRIMDASEIANRSGKRTVS